MANQPKKLDAKSRMVLAELESCVKEFGAEDCAPTGFTSHEKSLAETPGRGRRFPARPLVADEQFRRLKVWLAELTEANKPLAFSTLLQVWLDAHGIAWPSGVFKQDLATYGSGLLPSTLGRDATGLREQGKSWGRIAQELIPDECKTAADRARASEKVRLAADAYRNGVRRERPIEGSAAALAWKMLDVMPAWALELELRDSFDEP
jgi:hypothetical protein